MHEAPLGVPGFRPGIGKQQEQLVQTGIRQGTEQTACIVGPKAQVGRQGCRRFLAFRHQCRQERANAVLEHLAGDQGHVRVGTDLRQGVLAAAETHLKLQGPRRQLAQQQPGQGDVEQDFLARP